MTVLVIGVLHGQSKEVSSKERLSLLKRAQVWKETDVSRMNVRVGPPDGAFRSGSLVVCDYVEKDFGGRTPKFACTQTVNGKASPANASERHQKSDALKVRYGRDNGEIYAGIAATRLLWALGFGADGLYPVRVLCRGCPDALNEQGTPHKNGILFDVAAIERPFAGEDIEARGAGQGWSWPELDQVDEQSGGAPVAQRDALKLLAAFLQHSDNKAVQQRLVCSSGERKELGDCAEPFLMIHDLGITFGRATLLNNGRIGSANLEEWAKTPVWKGSDHCVANLPPSQSGTLEDPVITEGGRRFLLGRLSALTDRQLTDLFTTAMFDKKPSGGGPVAGWVAAFVHKRDEIAARRCY